METLILNGSPRKDGDTVSLINRVVEGLNGDYKIVNAYKCDVNPCVDCRYCWKNSGCCVDDQMQDIYSYIQKCDNILIASPIYFSQLTGKLLDIGSRLQTYYCARYFRNEEPVAKNKKAAVIVVGGGDGNVNKSYETACTLLHQMNSYDILPLVFSHDTNKRPAIEDEEVLIGVNGIVRFFNNV